LSRPSVTLEVQRCTADYRGRKRLTVLTVPVLALGSLSLGVHAPQPNNKQPLLQSMRLQHTVEIRHLLIANKSRPRIARLRQTHARPHSVPQPCEWLYSRQHKGRTGQRRLDKENRVQHIVTTGMYYNILP
jgi:hypothetical protein